MRKQPLLVVLGLALACAVGIAIAFLPGEKVPVTAPQSQPATQSSPQSKAQEPPQPDWSRLPGSLVHVGMQSTVGVLLDDIPPKNRDAFVLALSAKPQSFWTDRATRQIRMTSLLLNFRNVNGKKQLPLPPEKSWTIELQGAPRRESVEGHDVVAVGYTLSSVLLSDEQSPGESEPALKNIGGIWSEPFVLPIDPEFVFQRTGFACMNESEFPPNSMDAEESDLFYDYRCRVEKKLSNTGCHQTELPTTSCIAAVSAKIGKVETAMRFERLPWNAETAAMVRTGTVTSLDGPDLEPYKEEFLQHRFTYRYIPEDSCTLVERCVGASGWRQLLQFPTADLNVGGKPLEIGTVDYFLQHQGSILSEHGVFEFSACHQHYHFSHYGSFTLGNGLEHINRKNGFCMQPTARLANNELSPLHHPYVDCIDQGVSAGWIDEYKMGLECQWLDVSDVKAAQDLPLSFTTNPDGLLCEGELKTDAQGKQLFEPTNFKTSNGDPVERPQCNVFPSWADNNTESYLVHIPEKGESSITEECRDGLFGPLRNCGLTRQLEIHDCKPGEKVSVRCSAPAGNPAQVVRVCEASRALKTGIPCTFNDALTSQIVDLQKDFDFTCPTARDDRETGGLYSYFTGALFPGEPTSPVTCVVQ